MNGQFYFQRVTGNSPLADLGPIQSENPFCTNGYRMAKQQLGYQCWVIGIQANGILQDATIAFALPGRVSSTFEIVSLPGAAQRAIFWDGVYGLMKRLNVTDLFAETFHSPSFEIPPLRGEISRRKRIEYILEIGSDNLAASLSSNHKKNIKKARMAGVTVRHSSEPSDSLADHARMIRCSRDRRAGISNPVSENSVETKEHWAYLASGAGELFQAVHNERVVSSLLLLRSAHAAYFQSAGTSPQGMRIGASHFLVYDVCRELFREGVRTFNLGGALEGSSLAGFKAGFGAAEVTLYECACYIGPVWRKKVRSALQLVRTDRAGLWKLLSGNSYQTQVYALSTDAPMQPIPVPIGARFQPLSPYDLLALAPDVDEPQFRERQLDRLQRFGTSHAYGVYIGDKLAHVSWLLPPAAVALERPRILTLNHGEAEITGCETLPEFRGRNLYAFAIQQIFQTARSAGIHKICMKTRKDDFASQSGILKAGLQPAGIVTVVTLPVIPSKSFVLRHLQTAS
jgi:hypothetical protein